MSQEEDKSTKRSSKAKLSPLIKPEAAPTATNFPSITPRSSKKPSTRKFFGKSTNKLDLNWGECRAIQNVFPCKYNTHSHSSSSFDYFFIELTFIIRPGRAVPRDGEDHEVEQRRQVLCCCGSGQDSPRVDESSCWRRSRAET